MSQEVLSWVVIGVFGGRFAAARSSQKRALAAASTALTIVSCG
jgi:hypothetical protein